MGLAATADRRRPACAADGAGTESGAAPTWPPETVAASHRPGASFCGFSTKRRPERVVVGHSANTWRWCLDLLTC